MMTKERWVFCKDCGEDVEAKEDDGELLCPRCNRYLTDTASFDFADEESKAFESLHELSD